MSQHTPIRSGLALAALWMLVGPAAHGQTSAAEERLRDQLRQTTVQLRDAQDTVADLRSQLDAANKQLEAQRAAVATASAAPRRTDNAAAELRKAVEERNQRLEETQQQLGSSQKLLGQWQQAYNQAAALARARDADAKKFEGQYQEVNARMQTCTADNAELVRISQELLHRYKSKGVWQALKTGDPITQLSRVKLEALAQDYHISIDDHSIAPPAADTPQ